jgi:two-component system chemotaxis sensor kinase CheA
LDGAIGQEEAAIETGLNALDAADRALGEQLQFTALGLGLRNRQEFTAKNLRRKWSELEPALPGLGLADGLAAYQSLINHTRTMITHAGDTSNLILDPDLDSYYLMDVTLLALPQMEERLQLITAEVHRLAATRELRAEDATKISTLAAFLAEADWQRVVASTNTAINEDRNFQDVSTTLGPVLKGKLQRGEDTTTKVLARLRRLATDRTDRSFDVAAFDAEMAALADATYDLHRAALTEEDQLLRARAGAFRRELWLGCALAAASLLISGLLAAALARNITNRVVHISRATKAFAAGEMAARVGAAGGDELGELGQSFDVMADRIGGLASEVRQRAEELEQLNQGLEATVEQRTTELLKRNEAVRLILDNAHDGMLTADLHGVMSSERSAAVARWFGDPEPGALLPDYLGRGNSVLTKELLLGLEELRDDMMPLQVTLGQLPKKLVRGSSHYGLVYQPIFEDERLSRLLVVISDVTSDVANARASALQEETVRIFHACQRDRVGFIDFFANARELVEQLTDERERPLAEVARAVHTLKGNCALFGVFSISGLCHQIEDNMVENGGALTAADVERLRAAWGELALTVARVVGEHGTNKVEIADDEYAGIVDAVASGVARKDILVAIAKWKLEPTSRRLHRLAERAQDLAKRLGKELEVDVQGNGLRLCTETWTTVWVALSHVVRNCVDHGIELGDERVERGKRSAGTLCLRTRLASQRFYIEIADDGRGVDWERVAVVAKSKGLPCQTERELAEALFADGVSTVDVVTEWSGRGVGMAAVREACARLGGTIEVESRAGQGTTIRCSFPEHAMEGMALAAARERPIAMSIQPVADA